MNTLSSLLLLQSSVFPALCTAVYAAVVEQWASNPEVGGAFCGRPWHPLHTQAICGGGARSRLLTLGTTEPFACRCPNVNKMHLKRVKKNHKVGSNSLTLLAVKSVHSFFKKHDKCLTTFVSNCDMSQKETKKACLKRPLRKKEHKSYFGKNRTHDFRTSRCAGYLLDHSGDEGFTTCYI